MYPGWLLPNMTFGTRQTAVAALRGSSAGSFAFVKEVRAARDHMGRPLSQEFALHQTRGNQYLADLMLQETDPDTVRVVFKPQTGVMSLPVATAQMGKFASLDAFCADFSRGTGHTITADKLWVPRRRAL